MPDSQDAFGAVAFIEESSPGTINATPTLTIPPSGPPLSFQQPESGFWVIENDAIATQSDLDTFFPNGVYTLNYTGVNDGAVSGTLSITGDLYPDAPQLTQTSFNALQAADLSQGVSLTWNSFTVGEDAGTADDLIIIEIEDRGSGSEVPLTGAEPGDIIGSATTFSIPASTLAADGAYEICITFIKVTEGKDIGGAQAIGGYLSETCLEVGEIKILNLNLTNNDGFFGQPTGMTGSLQSTAEHVFPLITSYSLNYTFEDDGANFPDISTVTFDGPAGSNITGLAADFFSGPASGILGFGTYLSPQVATPESATSADTYTVSISSTLDFSKTFDLATALAHQLVAVPTFHLGDDDTTLDSITIEFKLPDGTTPGTTGFIEKITYEIFWQDGNMQLGEFDIPVTTTLDLSFLDPGITMSEVEQFFFSYSDFG